MQTLFDFSKPKVQSLTPSAEAFEKVKPSKNALQRKVLDSLADFGPQTTEHLAATTGCDERTIQPRTTELKQAGKILAGEKRGTNSRGSSVTVSHLAETKPKTDADFKAILDDYLTPRMCQ